MTFLGAERYNIPPEHLVPADLHYNPSITRIGDKLLMAYRYQHRIFPRNPKAPAFHITPSRVGFAFLDNNYNVLNSFPSDLGEYVEDPRLFQHQEQIYMMHNGQNKIRVSKLKKNLEQEWTKELPQLRDIEKNWVFYSNNNRIYSIYQHSPYEVWEWDKDFNVREKRKYSNELGWRWGEVRGGAGCILPNGYLLSLFHSCYFYPIPNIFDNRIYAVGYLVIDPERNKIMGISREPVFEPEYRTGHKGATESYVIFPCGMIMDRGKLLISTGLNDETCQLIRIDPRELLLVDTKPIRGNEEIIK